MTDPRWTKAIELAAIPVGGAKAIKRDGHQIAFFRPVPEEVQAVDNRCPHEGYPLVTGTQKDGVLTCEWHNWKFRLCDGVCLVGGENVRHFPVRIEGDLVYVDLAEPPDAGVATAQLASLDKALDEEDWSHAARAIERLLAALPPEAILAHLASWSAVRAPYGFDHGHAAAADRARLLRELPEEADLILLDAAQGLAEPHARRPSREHPPAETFFGVDFTSELRRRIEAEELEGAEALMRGAIAARAPREIFDALTRAATDHFYDYGHGQIYCVKAEELLESIGFAHAHPILTCLVTGLVYGTREDRLPYMRAFQRTMDELSERLPAWHAAGYDSDARLDVDSLVRAVVGGTLSEALAAVEQALDARVAPPDIALALGIAAAERILRYDTAHDLDDTSSESWLSVTHALTHADAVRESLLRHPSGDALRGLFHNARLTNHLAPLDAEVVPDREALLSAAHADPDPSPSVHRAIVRAAAVLPIFAAHQVKTPMAALRLTAALEANPTFARRADRRLPVAAANRFLGHPQREQRNARRAVIARVFVREGKMPKKLLGY